jgi:hypothetical protein
MNTPLTQTVNNGHRNTSLLGAFALVLALAFGVSTSSSSAAAASGQQLVPLDLNLCCAADVDAPFDAAIPVVSAIVLVLDCRQQAPQVGRLPQGAAASAASFLARAPPLMNS